MIHSAPSPRCCWSSCRNRVLPGRSNVFRLACCHRMKDGRPHFQQVAERRGCVADELWQEVLVSEDEFTRLASPK